MLHMELETAAPGEDRPIRGLRWSDVTTRQVQMELNMERGSAKLTADARRLACPGSSFQRVTATDRTRVGVPLFKKTPQSETLMKIKIFRIILPVGLYIILISVRVTRHNIGEKMIYRWPTRSIPKS